LAQFVKVKGNQRNCNGTPTVLKYSEGDQRKNHGRSNVCELISYDSQQQVLVKIWMCAPEPLENFGRADKRSGYGKIAAL
jgi:hypothetical protein